MTTDRPSNPTVAEPPRHEGHPHGLTRGAETRHVSDVRLLWTVTLNQVLTVAQLVAGIVSGSVALLSDAAHNFNDANALLIAYVARRISRKEANRRYTFGYRRAELIGAMINLTLLGAVGAFLIYEGVMRLIEPEPIIGWLMAAAAGLALVVDVATALLLWSMSRGSLNVRAAYVHNLVDALASVAVLVGAATIIWLDWTWVDSMLTLSIAGYVLWQVVVMLPQAARVLMEGAPEGLEFDALVERVRSLDGVEGLHHVHVWQLDENHRAIEAHVVIRPARAEELEGIKRRVKRLLADEFHVGHSTLELEYAGTADQERHDTSIVAGH